MPSRGSLPILTYHSISDHAGPTSIPSHVFRAQMEALRDLGIDVVPLDRVAQWLRGDAGFDRSTVAITFDDAFRDFAEAAHPVLDSLQLHATVFVPTAVVGGTENWVGANKPPRPLMDAGTIRALSAAGVDFGSHTRTHRDLTTLSDDDLETELSVSRRELEEMLGKAAPHFAPPYGRSSPVVQTSIAKHYSLSVGVRLDEARRSSPLFDLPRIEMHYFRDLNRWRSYIKGHGNAYFSARRAARALREAVAGLLPSVMH